jgi:hypothetical protein
MKWPFQKKPALPKLTPVRERNTKLLKDQGFTFAAWLPMRDESVIPSLRPTEEIAGRLAALNALFAHVVAPEDAIPSDSLAAHIQAASLESHMTEDEQEIIKLSRKEAAAEHGNVIGWRSENAMVLAWILGRDRAPTIDGAMLKFEEIQEIVTQWPPMGSGFASWRAALRPRPVMEVVDMADLFYCAHNAARSAQVQMMQARGKAVRYSTVPAGFDPVANGGVIHERRHALWWAVSPGEEWDEVDLST